MKELILLLQADIDIQQAYERYEDYQKGRGVLFMQQLDVVLGLLKRQPESGARYAHPYRRMLMRDFPYGVFYDVQPTRIVVVTITDLRQNPSVIHRKVFGPT